jgi:[protein-PII] uridylyltransferase
MERERQNPRIFELLSRPAASNLVPPRFAVLGGQVFLEGYNEYYFAGEPGVRTLMDLMRAAQERGLTFSHHLRRQIRRSIPLVRLHLNYLKDAHQQFLALLRSPGRIAPVMRVMYETGLLGAILPEFEGITCLYQYDNYHQFTVDEHTLRVLEEAEELAETSDPELQAVREAAGRVKRPEILRLAILLHDAGKAEGRAEHVRVGVRLATRVCERLGVDSEAVRSVKFLVENHLLMSRMAHRRDLSDSQIINHFTSTVGSPEMLDMLYTLTCADIRGVSRWAWTGWKGSLLEELYGKSRISFGLGDAHAATTREDIRSRMLELVPAGISSEELDAHLTNVPERYIWDCEPEEMAHHLELIRGLRDRSFVTSMKRKTSVTELTICTTDRFGLFADITGSIAGAGFNVWGAEIFTREDGVVIDIFYLLDVKGDPVDPSRREHLDRVFDDVFSGRKKVEDLIRRQAKRVILGQRRPPAVHPPRVRVDNDSAQSYTILDVYAHDRVGVLYEISRAISGLGLDIHLAKIATHVDQILDVFYVTDRQGNKVTDSQELEKIEATLREVLERDQVTQ